MNNKSNKESVNRHKETSQIVCFGEYIRFGVFFFFKLYMF